MVHIQKRILKGKKRSCLQLSPHWGEHAVWKARVHVTRLTTYPETTKVERLCVWMLQWTLSDASRFKPILQKHQPCEWRYFQILPQAWKVPPNTHTHTSRVSWILPAEAPDILNQKQAFLFLLCPIHIPDTKNPGGFFFFLSTLLSFGVVDETVIGNWNHMSKREVINPLVMEPTPGIWY